MDKKTISGTYSGVSYFVNIYDHGMKYKAESIALLPSHAHVHDWNAPGQPDLMSPWVTCEGNHFFYYYPGKHLVDATQGMIDSLLDLQKQNPERLNAITQEAAQMQRMRPDTNPTPSEVKAMRKEIDRLINSFSIVGLAHLTGKTSQTINNWRARGRISATAAHEVCQIEEIKALGFTRESLRPDVKFWYIEQ